MLTEKLCDKIAVPSDGGSNSVTLWGVNASPYVRKVMVALEEKNIAYTHIEILPKCLLEATEQTVPALFNQASPLGKIPVLQVDNFFIADSSVIIGYLERLFDETPLYPKNAEEYARTLWFERYSDTVLTDVGYKKIFFECVIKPKILNLPADFNIVETAKNHELPPTLDYLNQSVAIYPWVAGNEFSVADIAIATQLLALKMAGVNIDNKKWNHLNQYLEKVISRKSFNKINLH